MIVKVKGYYTITNHSSDALLFYQLTTKKSELELK